MQEQVIKVGLIGLGNMGRNHLRVLSMLKGADLAFVADVNPEVAAKVGEVNGISGVVDSTPLLGEVNMNEAELQHLVEVVGSVLGGRNVC